MEGVIPSFASSNLEILALHKNRFKVIPDIHFKNDASKTLILLHNNLLSCSVPSCGNAVANRSIVAIGNQLRYPKGSFPAWVSKREQDTLLWVSGSEGLHLSAPHPCDGDGDGHPAMPVASSLRCHSCQISCCLIILLDASVAKGRFQQWPKGDAGDVKYFRWRCRNTGNPSQMTLQNRGNQLRCSKSVMCITAICVAAM